VLIALSAFLVVHQTQAKKAPYAALKRHTKRPERGPVLLIGLGGVGMMGLEREMSPKAGGGCPPHCPFHFELTT
jgi:hypothetical protein